MVKFRLSSLVIFTSVMAYLIAAPGPVSWIAVVVLALGGFLVTGAANALNQVLERDYDRLMKRTADRPLASRRMEVSEAVMAAGFMSMFGIVLLAMFNPWTALLGTLALISYSFVYTPMKRISPLAVMVGAVPGALPMMIGCVAAEGDITALACALFGIQLLWQFPHFWAIAWLGHEDYTNAGFNLLPSKTGEPDEMAGWQSFIYALMLIPVSLMPYFLGLTGLISAVLVLGLGLVYAWYSWNMYRECTRIAARKLMFSSFFYLPLALIIFLLDKM
ncbi:MAG: heme o synthase [Bacteroidota bacterium]